MPVSVAAASTMVSSQFTTRPFACPDPAPSPPPGNRPAAAEATVAPAHPTGPAPGDRPSARQDGALRRPFAGVITHSQALYSTGAPRKGDRQNFISPSPSGRGPG